MKKVCLFSLILLSHLASAMELSIEPEAMQSEFRVKMPSTTVLAERLNSIKLQHFDKESHLSKKVCDRTFQPTEIAVLIDIIIEIFNRHEPVEKLKIDDLTKQTIVTTLLKDFPEALEEIERQCPTIIRPK